MKRFLFTAFLLLRAVHFMYAEEVKINDSLNNAEFIHRALKQVTDVIVYDIYSPPVASRIYAYVTVGGYEAALVGQHKNITLAGQLNDLPALPAIQNGDAYNPVVGAVQAMLTIAKSMVISDQLIVDFQDAILKEMRAGGITDQVWQNSITYGNQVASHILAWASRDNYKQTRAMHRYNLTEDESSWKPTPPAYMKAIEPHWSRMRTFVIDNAAQFKPPPPTAFSTEKNSLFYRQANDVFMAGTKLTAEQREIAAFWDCNPFKMNVNGHVMYATKKISPGGHWINITRLASKQAKADFLASLEVYACISIAMADAFISCWDEKYRSNVIRPETYINQYIDANWMPLLQTPPFPEYTSGHSVVSKACAIILTRHFGDQFSYSDSTELEFGLPVRQFTSFHQAAAEAAISRFYGGIHYMPAISQGLAEGEKLGIYISEKINTRRTQVSP